MYKKSDLATVDLIAKNNKGILEETSFSEYHPLSYYILGGSDPTGRQLEETGDIGFDTNDAMDFGVSVDPLCDARTSMFDLIESLGTDGVQKAEDYISARKNKPESNN